MVNLFHVEENDLKSMTVGMLALNTCTLLTTGNVPAELKHTLIHLKAEEWEKVLMDHPDDGFVAFLLSERFSSIVSLRSGGRSERL